VFSPYYHWAGHADPEDHVAVNVALYGPGARRWTMTERGRGSLARDATSFAVGPSAMAWRGDTLALDLDEVSVPVPRRVRGRVLVHPIARNTRSFAIDGVGTHRWMPIAPTARVEVTFDDPALSWSGHGYFDTNAGDEPVARAFRTWDWSRTPLGHDTAILYDAETRDGRNPVVATLFKPDGSTEDFDAPPRQPLPGTFWRVARRVQADAAPRLVETLEDTPFYARSVIATRIGGREGVGVHETLDVRRLDTPIVRAMLPFRMPRRG
jgi:carotenoid 1,2-hydratase